jgi:uncharacterized hydrophobic protein (TIGR00271 family)
MKQQVKTARDTLARRLKHLGAWRRQQFMASLEHAEVVNHVREDGVFTTRYAFMVTMSCGIAILGLLLSSPAVVIGAMLISPLMGPIMSLGLSLCILDLRQLRTSLVGVAAGVSLSIGVSFLIVKLSPLTEVTPEILARTQPNLFDLLVAILSGMAGGYAIVKRKGEAIVGVAIATALMPPLAVVGYGLAVWNAQIAQGAFFLFMTNLLAIALSVTVLAKWYGFGSYHSKHHTIWQTLLILAVFTALSLPLGLALREIAYQSLVTNIVRNAINSEFKADNGRLSTLNIATHENKQVVLDALVLTRKYHVNAEKTLSDLLNKSLNRQISLRLDQIVLANPQDSLDSTANTDAGRPTIATPALSARRTAEDTIATAIRSLTWIPLQSVQADDAKGPVRVYPRRVEGLTLVALRSYENELAKRFPAREIQVIPPLQPLPLLYFETGQDNLDERQLDNLKAIAWTLTRWGITEVVVAGNASLTGDGSRFNNAALAQRRAEHVHEQLSGLGIESSAVSEYSRPRQAEFERRHGSQSMQQVEIRLPPAMMVDES